jgi:hypothetical protein
MRSLGAPFCNPGAMTVQADTDPRIGALADLAQNLLMQFTTLATTSAEHLPDGVRAEMVEHVNKVAAEARNRFAEIAAMGSSADGYPVGEYRLSTRAPAVGGAS